MIATEVENQRVEHPGKSWIQAIMDGRLDRLEQFCHPQVNSQLLTPKRFTTLENAGDLVAKFRQWFGECTDFRLEASRVGSIGERLGIYYRFILQEQGDWYTIEQQLYCSIRDGRVEQLHLLCSGFQLVGRENPMDPAASPDIDQEGPLPDGLLEVYTESSANGSTCAVLTPAIRSKLREMQSGQILEVRVDDTAARGDIEAWCRLSGNELLKVIDEQGQILRFFLKKK